MVAGVWLAIQLWTVFVVLLVALVLVGTFDPLVGWFERRGLGRGRALALIFFATALAIARDLARSRSRRWSPSSSTSSRTCRKSARS